MTPPPTARKAPKFPTDPQTLIEAAREVVRCFNEEEFAEERGNHECISLLERAIRRFDAGEGV